MKNGNSKSPVHIKIDSGMNRVGFNKENIEEMTGFILKIGKIEVKSIFSHLAAAVEKRHDEFTLALDKTFR